MTITPGSFCLIASEEYFQMPDNVAAEVKDKSSWARVGVALQNTFIDPGWCGFLTMELSHHGRVPQRLLPGDPIAQIVFYLLTQSTEQPYRGKYQNQERGPQEARRES